MGNGSRLKPGVFVVDTETDDFVHSSTPPLTQDMLEKAAQAALSNFGKPNMIYMGSAFMSSMGWSVNPEYAGTPWEDTARMTKREHAFAKIHTFLHKLKILKNLSEEEQNGIRDKAIKRLKRAAWARYQQRSKSGK